MKRGISCVLVAGLVCLLVLVPGLYAQATKDAKTGLDKIEGTVTSIDKAKSTMSIRQKSGTSIMWNIVYNADTKFTYRNSPSTVDEVKDGRRVICLGKFDDKTTMTAARIDIRTK
jgi:hypothetical protein